MKLYNKRILFLVADNVSVEDVYALHAAFENESAQVFFTAPESILHVESVNEQGEDVCIPIDIPLDAVQASGFDALCIPAGRHAQYLGHNASAQEVIRAFHMRSLPIFVRGEVCALLQYCGIIPRNILICTTAASVIEEAINALLESVPGLQRVSIAPSMEA